MTSDALTFGLFSQATAKADATTKPPARRAPPVLIHDAIIPWNGETLLLSLLRQQALEDDQPPD